MTGEGELNCCARAADRSPERIHERAVLLGAEVFGIEEVLQPPDGIAVFVAAGEVLHTSGLVVPHRKPAVFAETVKGVVEAQDAPDDSRTIGYATGECAETIQGDSPRRGGGP